MTYRFIMILYNYFIYIVTNGMMFVEYDITQQSIL